MSVASKDDARRAQQMEYPVFHEFHYITPTTVASDNTWYYFGVCPSGIAYGSWTNRAVVTHVSMYPSDASGDIVTLGTGATFALRIFDGKVCTSGGDIGVRRFYSFTGATDSSYVDSGDSGFWRIYNNKDRDESFSFAVRSSGAAVGTYFTIFVEGQKVV